MTFIIQKCFYFLFYFCFLYYINAFGIYKYKSIKVYTSRGIWYIFIQNSFSLSLHLFLDSLSLSVHRIIADDFILLLQKKGFLLYTYTVHVHILYYTYILVIFFKRICTLIKCIFCK